MTNSCLIVGAKGITYAAGITYIAGGTIFSSTGALTLGLVGVFTTGAVGYSVRTLISDPESFEWQDMLIEAGMNAFSGLLSYHDAMVGGIVGLKIPGSKLNFKYHTTISQIGIYSLKIALAYIKSKLKECN